MEPIDFLAQIAEGLEDRVAVLQKQFPGVDVKSIAQYDPSGKGDFLTWLCRMVRDGTLRFPEDGQKVTDRLNQFMNLKRAPRFTGAKDINQYKTYGELAQTIDTNLGVKSKGEQVRQAQVEGAENLGKFGEFEVVRVTTPEAGAKLFRGTEWCVKDPKYFDQYKPPFFLFLAPSGDRHALLNVNDGFDFKDTNDDDIEPNVHTIAAVMSLIKTGVVTMSGESFLGACDNGFIKSDPVCAQIAIKAPDTACSYAVNVLGQRWPEAEPVIVKDAVAAVEYTSCLRMGRWLALEAALLECSGNEPCAQITYYARNVIRGRWPEGEKALLAFGDPSGCAAYASDVVHGRWPEAEPLIASDAVASKAYASSVLHARFPAGEPAIMCDPNAAYGYAASVIRGRWPEAEPFIAKSPVASWLYAWSVIGGRFPEGEAAIKTNPFDWDRYCEKFMVQSDRKAYSLYGPFASEGDVDESGSKTYVEGAADLPRIISDKIYGSIADNYDGGDWIADSELAWEECKMAGRALAHKLVDNEGHPEMTVCNDTDWYFVLRQAKP